MSVFAVIAEPRRRELLDLLRNGEASVGTLVDRTHMSQPLVSKHLRVLRDAGLVDVEVHAQQRRYRLRAEPLADLDAWLEPYRAVWGGRLDALERHLDQIDPPPNPTREDSTP
ncbi:MAG TPA: metalloregulator ArsR/SmtB family transcription factor [Actinopolymorphaceae bacterium]